METRKTQLFLCALALILAFAPMAFGQAVTATLVGLVTDHTGAVVTNATVTITEKDTAAVLTQTTNGSGNYEFTFLPPGVYSVSVISTGFETAVTKDVQVPVNTTARVDVSLQAGSTAQTVTVTDQAPLLQTDRADVSAQIETQQVADLPTGSNRNFQALESLIPGVSKPIYDHSSFFDAQNSQSFQVNGQSELSNNLQLEGIDDNERTGLLQVYIAPAAAIQTVDIETSNYAPEFGRSAGAVTNVTLKSGTNRFHGSAYEFNSVSATSSRSYFNRTGQFPRFTNNYYGGTIGGPIRKDRLFFFGDFLRYSNDSSQFQLLTVPTTAFRTGDLSAGPSAIYDPNTGNPDGTGRTQFAGNVIPGLRLSPIAQKILALVPQPNVPGAGFTNNFQKNVGFRVASNQFDAKLDQSLRASDHLALRYSLQRVNTTQDPVFGLAGGPTAGGFEGTGTNTTYNTAGNYTHFFSKSLLTEFRLGVDHYRNIANSADHGSSASTTLGVPGVNVDAFTSGLVGINLGGGYSGPLVGYSASLPWVRAETNIDGVNNWIKIAGNHSLKVGLEIRRVRDDLIQGQTFSPRGVFNYSDGQTGLNSKTSKTSFANNFASFLLDVPNQVGRDVNVGDATWRETQYFAFLQDTWQASQKITLTYGVRWEFYPPTVPNRKGGYSQYDPATNSLLVSGYGSVPNNLGLQSNYHDFEPRIGVAYRASPGTVVRAGFGISYTPFQDNNYAFNAPVRSNIAFNSLSSYTPAVGYTGGPASLSQGFPPLSPPVIPANGIIPNASLTSNYVVVNTKYKDPYVMSYNVTVEQDLGHQWVSDVAYVGNLGRDIPVNYNLNAGLVAGLGAKGRPEFATFGRTADTELLPKGYSTNYNSLQARLTHRFSQGFSATSGFTFQKAMGYNSSGGGLGGLNFYLDPHRDYSVLGFNRRETFSQSVIYQLPFGKGRSMLSHGVGAALLGGWQASGILAVQSGTPLFFSASGSQLNAPGTTQVPNQIMPFIKLNKIGTQNFWFDPTSFVNQTGAVLGNVGKNVYSGPGNLTLDASGSRSFPIHEGVDIQLRVDAFNALNHPTFGNPNTSLGDSNFGRVTGSGGGRSLQLAGTISF